MIDTYLKERTFTVFRDRKPLEAHSKKMKNTKQIARCL
jgi:hypothetical protein